MYDCKGILKNYIKSDLENLNNIRINKTNVLIVEPLNFFIHHDFPTNIASVAYYNNILLTNFFFARPLKPEYDYFNYKINHPEKGDLFIFEAHSKNFKKVNCSQIQKTKHYIFCQI